jgi:hypothetical protein
MDVVTRTRYDEYTIDRREYTNGAMVQTLPGANIYAICEVCMHVCLTTNNKQQTIVVVVVASYSSY